MLVVFWSCLEELISIGTGYCCINPQIYHDMLNITLYPNSQTSPIVLSETLKQFGTKRIKNVSPMLMCAHSFFFFNKLHFNNAFNAFRMYYIFADLVCICSRSFFISEIILCLNCFTQRYVGSHVLHFNDILTFFSWCFLLFVKLISWFSFLYPMRAVSSFC